MTADGLKPRPARQQRRKNMRRQILGPKQREWLAEVENQLVNLRAALARHHGAPEDEAVVSESIRHLKELFLLVVVGEFNSGKSAFINALLGESILEEGVVPTTTRIQVLKHGAAIEESAVDESTLTITAPAEILREIHIVDTPGTNAIDRHHETITRDFIPRADLVLFVTSTDRPFTESERSFLEAIRQWGKKIVFVLNKIDILESADEIDRVREFVAGNARELLHITPEIFAVSARVALRAKTGVNGANLERSGFPPLERYVVEALDEEERIRLKLLNPLGIARRLADSYLSALHDHASVLKQDVETIDELERHLAVYREDMGRDFRLRLSDVENTLHEMEARGHEFIEDVLRITRFLDLLNKDRIQGEFERKVVADSPKTVERQVGETIDWVVASDLRQWQFVQDHLSRRRSERSRQAVGEFAARFEYDRARLIDTVGRAAHQTLEEYNQRREANKMAESVQMAVAGTAVLEVGAVGLGTVVSLVATTTAADVTGILAAGLLAAVGFLIIPQRRRAARKELREKIGNLRRQLIEALSAQFEKEIDRNLARLRDAISPYTRFVRAEEKSLAEKREEFSAIRQAFARLELEISGASKEAGR